MSLILGLAVTASTSASRIPGKQHLANFGPFCVSMQTGVIHAAATGKPCKPKEVRIFHLIDLSNLAKLIMGLQDQINALKLKQGPTGPAGPAGKDGSNGTNGTNGTNGAIGPQGPAGPQGPKGDTGATGATGPAGAPGATGATGPQGEMGAAGAAGMGGCVTNCGGNNGSTTTTCESNCGGSNPAKP